MLPDEALDGSLHQAVAVVRIDEFEARRACEPRLISANFVRRVHLGEERRSLEPRDYGSLAAEATDRVHRDHRTARNTLNARRSRLAAEGCAPSQDVELVPLNMGSIPEHSQTFANGSGCTRISTAEEELSLTRLL
jgi:hypothetical protein